MEGLDDDAPTTLVILQVPRDQIYRVPPPEHALKMEEHQRNLVVNHKTKIRTIAIPLILVVALAIIAFFTVRATLYSPVTPEFTVTGMETHAPELIIVSIQGHNRNSRMSVSYTGGQTSALLFKDKKIGQGKIGSAGGGDHLEAVVAVTPELNKEMGVDKEKDMELNFELTVEMKSWIRNQGMDLNVSCDFRVRNSLMNVTQISFQECKKL